MFKPFLKGRPTVAIIDGPLPPREVGGAAGGLFSVRGPAGRNTTAYDHAAFVTALLAAPQGASIPGLCPAANFMHAPLFSASDPPSASTLRLAQAIEYAVGNGADIINLSLSLDQEGDAHDDALAHALDQAGARGVIVYAATGNRTVVDDDQLLSHAAVFPVVAVDPDGKPLRPLQVSPVIAAKWIGAPGLNVPGYDAFGARTVMTGDSAATAVATGLTAAFWLENRHLGSGDIRRALAQLRERQQRNLPLLRWNVLNDANHSRAGPPDSQSRGSRPSQPRNDKQGARSMTWETSSSASKDNSDRTGSIVSLAGEGGVCQSSAGSCSCSCVDEHSAFVYVLGTVDIRFPNPSISEELVHISGAAQPKNNEDLRKWYNRVLSRPNARYVARQVIWLLTVEGVPAYYLKLRDLADLDTLVAALKRPRNEDLNLVVGVSSLKESNLAGELSLPVLHVEQTHSFAENELVEQMLPVAPAGHTAIAIFKRIVQSADNMGVGEWRALNFLALRLKPLYDLCATLYADKYSLKGVHARTSRLSRGRSICDPIFEFQNDQSGVVVKYFARVDMTDIYPVLITPLQEYFDRPSIGA